MTPHALRYYTAPEKLTSPTPIDVDIVVYGGTSGGITTAIQARRLGKTVALVAFNQHLGGLTTGGLGATDVGNKGAFGGIAREFYRRVGGKYDAPEAWTFEPHVAQQVMDEMLEEAGVPVYQFHPLAKVVQDGPRITELHCENGQVFRAKMFVDASYEGDLMAAAGVSYTVGREANDQYDEIYNGVHPGHPNHRFKLSIDPYNTPGQPSSGLVWGISDEPLGQYGQADKSVQAYNFRLCLTQADDRLPFFEPDGYDPKKYELLARYCEKGYLDGVQVHRMMPNGKTDTNNEGGFSSDMIGMNHAWPDASYEEREKLFQEHVSYVAGMHYFLSQSGDPRIPDEMSAFSRSWGYCADEFQQFGGFSPELYVREARRMVSDYVMTEHNCYLLEPAPEPVALAAYQVDSHHCRRLVYGKQAFNEGNVEIGVIRPFGISYRSLVPKKAECENLIVPWCLSASHTAFGSIRMEPVFMGLGHVSADATVLAIDSGKALQDIDYSKLTAQLTEEKHCFSWPTGQNEPGGNPLTVKRKPAVFILEGRA